MSEHAYHETLAWLRSGAPEVRPGDYVHVSAKRGIHIVFRANGDHVLQFTRNGFEDHVANEAERTRHRAQVGGHVEVWRAEMDGIAQRLAKVLP